VPQVMQADLRGHELADGPRGGAPGHALVVDRPEFLGGCDLWESWDS
jgi:hypothetical protein